MPLSRRGLREEARWFGFADTCRLCRRGVVAVLLPDVLWWFSGGIPRLTFPYFSLRIASSDARPGPWTGSQLCGCRRSPGAFV